MQNINYLCRALNHSLVTVFRNDIFWATVVSNHCIGDISCLLQSKFAVSQLPAFINDYPFFPLSHGLNLSTALGDLDFKIAELFSFEYPRHHLDRLLLTPKYDLDETNLLEDKQFIWSRALVELARSYEQGESAYFYEDLKLDLSNATHLLALKTYSRQK
ncbi:MAG: hypothetical protein EOP04_07490 [Proteobacteria bacterium]|nr:MAG: hypothetical protein EOP04_07490 [Pseudomonadota bacterium]